MSKTTLKTILMLILGLTHLHHGESQVFVANQRIIESMNLGVCWDTFILETHCHGYVWEISKKSSHLRRSKGGFRDHFVWWRNFGVYCCIVNLLILASMETCLLGGMVDGVTRLYNKDWIVLAQQLNGGISFQTISYTIFRQHIRIMTQSCSIPKRVHRVLVGKKILKHFEEKWASHSKCENVIFEA